MDVLWATMRMKRKIIYKIEIEGALVSGNNTETFEEFMQNILGNKHIYLSMLQV